MCTKYTTYVWSLYKQLFYEWCKRIFIKLKDNWDNGQSSQNISPGLRRNLSWNSVKFRWIPFNSAEFLSAEFCVRWIPYLWNSVFLEFRYAEFCFNKIPRHKIPRNFSWNSLSSEFHSTEYRIRGIFLGILVPINMGIQWRYLTYLPPSS